jgi:exopolyphosphatase / guanosine-5'-triphosphate,3'-diphosphate pyrophosphatase
MSLLKIKDMETLASIEIGTNSIRMLIAEKDIVKNTLKPILRKRVITRLGKNFNDKQTRTLNTKPMSKSILVLRDFFSIAHQFDIPSPIVVATGVVREAHNRNNLLTSIHKQLGHTVKVITGEEESELTCRGVLSSLNRIKEPLVIFDCGGGSTEFIWVDNKKKETISINLGAVTLTDDYLTSDPPGDEEIYRLVNHIENQYKENLKYIKALCNGPFSMVGTGGTVINLAAMIHGISETEFEKKLHGLVIKKADIELLFTKMKRIPKPDRISLKGLEPGRENIILAGTLIIMKIMDYFEKDEITTSYFDLLEGLLLQPMGGKNNE